MKLLLLIGVLCVTSIVAGVGDDENDRVVDDQRGLTPPRLIKRSGSASIATGIAREHRISGIVGLEFEVTREGATENIKLVRPLDRQVDQALIEEVRKFRYEPATRLNGLPIRYKVKAEWKFGPWVDAVPQRRPQ
jgi:TonB family protein